MNPQARALAKGFDFKSPNYLPVIEQRIRWIAKVRANPDMVPSLRLHYAANPADFISQFGWTYDPRLVQRGLPANVPFVLWPRQIEWCEWVIERWKRGEPGLTEKSRDQGASCLAMAFAVTLCLFNDGVNVGVGSRKEDLLDRSGDPSTLMFKARQFVSMLPPELNGGWDVKRHSAYMRLTFPQAGSSIVAESGDDIGRGGRTSLFLVDESAFLERPELIDRSLSANTTCRIDMSSVNGSANSFADKRFSGKISVFQMHWRSDPRRDEAWYRRQCEILDPVTVGSELDLNYHASTTGQLIESKWVQAAIGAHTKLGIKPTGTKLSAFDPADEGADKNAFCGRHGVLVESLSSWSGRGSDLYQSTTRVMNLCDDLGYTKFTFDGDGLGAAIHGDANRINEAREAAGKPRITANPFRGSSSVYDPRGSMVSGTKNEDYFLNAKAQAWFVCRARFILTYRAVTEGLEVDPDAIISLDPNLPELAQLTMEFGQVTYTRNEAGKMKIQKKPDGARSPNLADAVVLAFEPSSRSLEIWVKLGQQT